MSSRNELLALFREIADLHAIEDGGRASFRVRAFEKAAEEIRNSEESLEGLTIAKLTDHKGIGKSTAECIREYYRTGKIGRLEELRDKFPEGFVALTRIPGMGAKIALRLRDELGVKSISDLRVALAKERLRELPGLGGGFEDKIRHALDRQGGKYDRQPISKVLPIAKMIVKELGELPEVEKAAYGGSLRRFQETIADIDIVVVSKSDKAIIDYVVNMPRVAEVIVQGERTASVYLELGIQLDVRVTLAEEFGAAMLYFTGNKQHNIELRKRASELGLALNEHSLHRREDETEVVASESEAAIYEVLGYSYIEPEMRQDHGELALAARGALPKLVSVADLRGDLHLHCDFSGDAKSPVEDMVSMANKLGYDYLAVSDHAENLRMNGVSADEHKELAKRIAALRETYPSLHILHGCELNIGRRGELDYSDEERMIFDICIASVHSHFDLSEREQTDRLIYAMEEPCVRILGHMLGRHIGKRPGIDIDVEEILDAALENDVAIEINSGLSRLDPPPHIVRRGIEKGNLFVINSDAHHMDHMPGIAYGIQHSHRAGLEATRVVNTWPAERFMEWLREPFI